MRRALADAWPDESERERMLEMLSQVHTGLERVSRVVQDMRSFSRVEPQRAAPVDVARVLEYAIGVAGAEVRARARINIEVDEPLYVRGDEARLGQVFVNLLVNAAHAIPDGAPAENHIDVSARREGGAVAIDVRDTGSGVPESVRAHLFEPFHTTKPAGVGIGLGLSICHAIVTSLGGTIVAEAPEGGGALFRVRLPGALEAAPVPAPAATPAHGPGARLKALVVDDEPILRRALSHMLSRECDVTVAASVDEALSVLGRDATFDAILCDIVMPGRTGLDFHAELSRRFPHLVSRLAFITGGVFDQRIDDFIEASGRPRIFKPFTADELLETVRLVAAD